MGSVIVRSLISRPGTLEFLRNVAPLTWTSDTREALRFTSPAQVHKTMSDHLGQAAYEVVSLGGPP